MNPQFSKPIRTYERKKCKDVAVIYPNLHIQSSYDVDSKNPILFKKKLINVERKEANDDSMSYDPFDTTFDRLARNTRIPPPVAKTCNNENSYNNSATSTSWNDNESENKSIEWSDVTDKKLISVQKIVHEKPKMQVVKKKIKRNKIKSKVKKSDTYKRYKLCKTKDNNKSVSTHLNIDSLNLPSEIDSEIRTQGKNYKKYTLGKSTKDIGGLNKQSTENIQMKSCSVVLNTLSTIRCDNKVNSMENDLSLGVHENTSKKQRLSKQDITKVNLKNVECNDIDVRYCFVKLKQLDVDSNAKFFNFGKKCGRIFSSTPKSRSVKSHIISLSPIGLSNKLNNSIMLEDNISTTADNKDSVSNNSNEVNACLHAKSDLPSTDVTNITNLSKCNLKLLKNSLTIFDCNDNNVCDQKEHSTEGTCEKSLKLVRNNSINEIKEIHVSNKLAQECVVVDTEKRKYQLNFSIDCNRSHSLFDDDTDENIGNKLHIDVAVSNKMSTYNTMLNKTNSTSDNEIIVDINSTDIKVTCDKIKEISSELSDLSKSVILDASLDVKMIETNGGLNKENASKQIESLPKKNDTSITDKSFVNNDKNHSVHDSYVILKRLQDPIRVSKRRKQYCKWNLDMTSIFEDSDNNTERINLERGKEPKKQMLSLEKLFSLENIIEESDNKESVEIKKSIYLKPGKSWARSLSILNNIQNISGLDKLSIGKGKRWRNSVQDVLNMQKQGIIQSCIKENSSGKELQVCNEAINESKCKLDDNKSRTCDSTNFGHLSRRISVCVVPIHKTVESIEDAPFLEVYGIVPVKSQRYTLLNNPKKSSACNIHSDDDFTGCDIKEHVTSTAKEVILQKCLQEDYIPFSAYFTDSYLEHCRKIGEGVYGEVFLYAQEDKKSVIKVIPIEGNEYVNGEPQKKFHEILSEIINIFRELHNLRFNTKYNSDGFVEVKNIKCIKGKYPEKLVELWNVYDEEKHSDNDCPSVFNDDQLYIVLELGHGGQDLEAFVFNTAEEAHILFIQAALALAVAEKAVEFEHRDLHWGNILISPTNDSHVYYKLGRRKIKLISKGVKVSIIDFTLSRVTYQGCSVFNDLALDPTLFTAQGEYQFEVYRLMRDKVKNDWQQFEPYTNILWLHYTLDKMITAVRYRKRNLRIHQNNIKKLQELKNEILTYSSAFDFVSNCDKIVNLVCNDS
ncbi:haspin isoform X1 [Osmia lignaria lignaria]|uniref:haspin isoform X1 n=1 Tax=Osmia lignaria lignaria TaxID=1437193 RepID=UPI00402B2E25